MKRAYNVRTARNRERVTSYELFDPATGESCEFSRIAREDSHFYYFDNSMNSDGRLHASPDSEEIRRSCLDFEEEKEKRGFVRKY